MHLQGGVMTKARIISALLASATLLPTTAFAQEAAAPEAGTAAEDGEIIVTARFRNESIQSVPIAITAITGQSLAERQLNTVETIARTVPAVDFRSGASN